MFIPESINAQREVVLNQIDNLCLEFVRIGMPSGGVDQASELRLLTMKRTRGLRGD